MGSNPIGGTVESHTETHDLVARHGQTVVAYATKAETLGLPHPSWNTNPSLSRPDRNSGLRIRVGPGRNTAASQERYLPWNPTTVPAPEDGNIRRPPKEEHPMRSTNPVLSKPDTWQVDPAQTQGQYQAQYGQPGRVL